jgi:hypothetical protein
MGPKALRPYGDGVWYHVASVPENVLALRPQNPKNSVKMIRHHGKGIEFDLRPDADSVEPLFPHNPAASVFAHLVTHNTAKHAAFPERADRNKICSGERIVVMS